MEFMRLMWKKEKDFIRNLKIWLRNTNTLRIRRLKLMENNTHHQLLLSLIITMMNQTKWMVFMKLMWKNQKDITKSLVSYKKILWLLKLLKIFIMMITLLKYQKKLKIISLNHCQKIDPINQILSLNLLTNKQPNFMKKFKKNHH